MTMNIDGFAGIEHFSKFGKLKPDTWEIAWASGKYMKASTLYSYNFSRALNSRRLRACPSVRKFTLK